MPIYIVLNANKEPVVAFESRAGAEEFISPNHTYSIVICPLERDNRQPPTLPHPFERVQIPRLPDTHNTIKTPWIRSSVPGMILKSL